MLRFFTCLVTGAFLVGCGADVKSSKPDPESEDQGGIAPHSGSNGARPGTIGPSAEVPDDPEHPIVVRARWEMPIANADDLASELAGAMVPRLLLGSSNATQPITATVAANVRFTVANDLFVTPATPEGVASYGALGVAELRDNELRVCGPSQNARCTSAALRLYTTGTPGAGLWSTVEAYGLPILTTGGTVGLGTAGARVLATVTISGSMRTVKLSDFVATPRFEVPVSVDFTEASAGSYASTLVVEYFVQ